MRFRGGVSERNLRTVFLSPRRRCTERGNARFNGLMRSTTRGHVEKKTLDFLSTSAFSRFSAQ